MSLVMERSPTVFENAREEDIRVHYLVQLNGQYHGKATGETFNHSGKTDILIRHENHNVFVAECKFWAGYKALKETTHQLLGYTTRIRLLTPNSFRGGWPHTTGIMGHERPSGVCRLARAAAYPFRSVERPV
jgi:hypothetical protein